MVIRTAGAVFSRTTQAYPNRSSYLTISHQLEGRQVFDHVARSLLSTSLALLPARVPCPTSRLGARPAPVPHGLPWERRGLLARHPAQSARARLRAHQG